MQLFQHASVEFALCGGERQWCKAAAPSYWSGGGMWAEPTAITQSPRAWIPHYFSSQTTRTAGQFTATLWKHHLYTTISTFTDHEAEETKSGCGPRPLDWSHCGGLGVILSLPGFPVSLRISLEGALSVSHLGRVFLRAKPFLMSASRWSMIQPSSWGKAPLLTGRTERKESKKEKEKVACVH